MRIVLDTNIVRNVIHWQGSDGQDVLNSLQLISQECGKVTITIAFTTYLELLEDLYATQDGTGIPWSHWTSNIGKILPLIDPTLPVLPDSPELAKLVGITTGTGPINPNYEKISQARWLLLSQATCTSDLAKEILIPGGDGSKLKLLTMTEVKTELDAKRNSYFTMINKYATTAQKPYHPFDRDKVIDDIKSREFGDVPPHTLDWLDPYFALIARNIREVKNGATLEKNQYSIAFDNDLLLALGLPAVVCTRDLKMLNILVNERKYLRVDKPKVTCGFIVPKSLASCFSGGATKLIVFPLPPPPPPNP